MAPDLVMYVNGEEVGRLNKCKGCEWLYNDICTCDGNKPCEDLTVMPEKLEVPKGE